MDGRFDGLRSCVGLMSGTRDECVFMARLAEQAERYEDMVERPGGRSSVRFSNDF